MYKSVNSEYLNFVVGGNKSRVLLPVSMSVVPLQEQDSAASLVPWSQKANNDPYGFISYAQSSTQRW